MVTVIVLGSGSGFAFFLGIYGDQIAAVVLKLSVDIILVLGLGVCIIGCLILFHQPIHPFRIFIRRMCTGFVFIYGGGSIAFVIAFILRIGFGGYIVGPFLLPSGRIFGEEFVGFFDAFDISTVKVIFIVVKKLLFFRGQLFSIAHLFFSCVFLRLRGLLFLFFFQFLQSLLEIIGRQILLVVD